LEKEHINSSALYYSGLYAKNPILPLSFLGVGSVSDNGLLGQFANAIPPIGKECRHHVMF
jgi:hypothetical protein